jgi:aromatic-L-amino-acid/L-tryptophan decarboxylase
MNPIEISPEQFKSPCEQFLAIAIDYLEEMDSRSITAKGSGTEIDRIFRAPLPETGFADEAIRAPGDIVQRSRVHNGRFFGYVLGSGEALGADIDRVVAEVLAVAKGG